MDVVVTMTTAKLSAILAAAIVALGAGIWFAGNRAGLAKGRSEVARVTVERYTDTVRVVDSIYRDRVRTLTKTLTEWDTVRTRDTLVRNDTVFVARAVADSAISMCRLTVFSCEARVVARDSVIGGLQAQIWAAQDSKPSWVERGTRYGVVGVLGVALGMLIAK